MRIVAWFSGGVTSAVACKIATELFDDVTIVFIDTYNEHPDTYRFMKDCEKWYGQYIEVVSNKNYKSIQDVWYKYNSLNVAHGAICSTELKRAVREKYLKENYFEFNVFGFDIDEPKRAKAMRLNYDEINPIFPLLLYGYTKKRCIKIIEDAGIEIPEMYKIGFSNNNCFQTGCVQGGIGYWQKIKKEFPEKFDKMAALEHELTNTKGQPVTILKDQSKKTPGLVFLKPHPGYPLMKDLSMMKGKYPEPLLECNGFCGTKDLITL